MNSDDRFQKLAIRWPHLFEKSTVHCLSIGPGWFGLVDTLCGLICSPVENKQRILKYEREKEVPDDELIKTLEAEYAELLSELPVVVDVKEKFGGLRFYINGGTEEHRNYIQFAEDISNITCEQCGAPGKHRHGGWIKTLCKNHKRVEDPDIDDDL